MDNINGWNEVFGDTCNILCVLVLNCSEELCVQRILERGQTSGRSDDNQEVLLKRFNTFYSESQPIVDYLKKTTRVIEINSGTVKEVFESICENLNKIL